MKNLTNALRMSVVFAILSLFIFASCEKSVPKPIDPIQLGEVSISSFTSEPSNIVYDGQIVEGKPVLNWVTKNAVSVSLDGLEVSKSGSYTSENSLYGSKTFLLSAKGADGKKKNQVLQVNVSVDPLFSKICGTQGLTWIMDSSFSYLPGGSPINNLTPCFADDKVTFYPNGNGSADQGNDPNCLTGIIVNKFAFNKSDTTIQFYPVELWPNQKVIFWPNGKIRFQYEKNGKTWVKVYKKV